MPVGGWGAGTKIHVVGSFGRRLRPSNRLYVRCGEWGRRCSSNVRFHRRFGESVLLLLMISARRKLLCATSANSQANRGRKHTDPDKSLQTGLLLIRSCHLQTLINLRRPMSQDRPLLQLARACEPKPFGRKCYESRRIFGLTPGGYHRGFANRVFANWSFADREFANWPRLYNGLRTREVRRNGCSHQGKRCSPNDHEFQHRSLLLPNLPQVDPNDRYEAISRAQTSVRTVSFLTDVAETARSFDN